MLPALFCATSRPNHLGRIVTAIQHRSYANVPSSGSADKSSASSNDPPLIKGMPELQIPKQYKDLVDVKQEPGYVIINGRRYPYPYPGIHGEYNYVEMLDKWRQEGKVDLHNRPIFRKMKGMEKILAKQLFYQRDPTLPVHRLGKYDDIWNMAWYLAAILQVILGSFIFYRVCTPKDKDIFDGNNWIRWHKEQHH